MKIITILISAILFSTAVFAQKAEVKNNEILSDGKSIAKIEKDGCGALSPTCNFYITNLDGEAIITVVALEMIDPMQISAGNPEGKVRFLRFSFTGINGVAEIRNPALLTTKPKDVAQSIVKARLIKDGKLYENAILNFIKANGTRFSDSQQELNPKVIFIEENKLSQ